MKIVDLIKRDMVGPQRQAPRARHPLGARCLPWGGAPRDRSRDAVNVLIERDHSPRRRSAKASRFRPALASLVESWRASGAHLAASSSTLWTATDVLVFVLVAPDLDRRHLKALAGSPCSDPPSRRRLLARRRQAIPPFCDDDASTE